VHACRLRTLDAECGQRGKRGSVPRRLLPIIGKGRAEAIGGGKNDVGKHHGPMGLVVLLRLLNDLQPRPAAPRRSIGPWAVLLLLLLLLLLARLEHEGLEHDLLHLATARKEVPQEALGIAAIASAEIRHEQRSIFQIFVLSSSSMLPNVEVAMMMMLMLMMILMIIGIFGNLVSERQRNNLVAFNNHPLLTYGEQNLIQDRGDEIFAQDLKRKEETKK